MCIVGGGAAGITRRVGVHGARSDPGRERRLRGRRRNPGPVRRFHAGGPVRERARPRGGDPLGGTRVRFFGGSTNHWEASAGRCGRSTSSPVRTSRCRVGRSASGWCRTTSGPKRSSSSVRSDTTGGSGWLRASRAAHRRRGRRPRCSRRSSSSASGPSTGTRSWTAPNIRLLTWANVTRLGVQPEGDLVEVAEIATLSGVQLQVRARLRGGDRGRGGALGFFSRPTTCAQRGSATTTTSWAATSWTISSSRRGSPRWSRRRTRPALRGGRRVPGRGRRPGEARAFMLLSDETLRAEALQGFEVQLTVEERDRSRRMASTSPHGPGCWRPWSRPLRAPSTSRRSPSKCSIRRTG